MKQIEVTSKGNSVHISGLVMGTTYFGTTQSPELAFEMLDRYRVAGGNTIDTARAYAAWLPGGESASERTVSAYIKSRSCREEVVLITKGCQHDNTDFSDNRLTREQLLLDFGRSAATLDMGHRVCDIYFLHRDHPNASIPEMMETLHSLVEAGRVGAIGASNWSLRRILEANNYAESHGLTPFCISEIQWSVVRCTPEWYGDRTLHCMTDEEFEEYRKIGLPVLAYSSQAKGLVQKMLKGGPEAVSQKALERFYRGGNEEIVRRVGELCKAKGYDPTSVVLSFVLDNELNAAAIIGCSNMAQLEDTLAGLGTHLDPEEIRYIIGKA